MDPAFEAFGWGILSASSLLLGSIIGVIRLPSKVVRAALMAFGGGALIEALSIELFGHVLEEARHSDDGDPDYIDRVLVFLALLAALFGGLLFTGLDRMLSSYGAFLRKTATVQAYAERLRHGVTRRLIKRLQMVPMFEILSDHQLHRLAVSMVRERYNDGAVIFTELDSHSSIFFLLSGCVELTVTTRYHGQKDAALSNDLSIHNSDGHDEVDHFVLGPNDLFGEMALFTSETVRAEAVAMSRSCVLRIPSQAVHNLLASNKRLQEFVAMTAVERLRETEVFRRCTPSTVARLVNFMTQAEFCAGDVLFHDVDSLCPIYFIVLGCVEVIQPVDTEGADTIKRRVLSANVVFGTEHLVGGRAVHATARALEQTTVLVIQRNDIDKLCRKDARFHQALLSSTTEAEAEQLVPVEGVAAPSKLGVPISDLWKHVGSPTQRQHVVPTPPGSSRGDDAGSGSEDDVFPCPDLEDLLESAEAEKGGPHAQGHAHKGRGLQTAIMIWLGILIDGVPESVVMGILVNSATTSSLLTFVVGVFLANFPEAMSSAGVMHAHGMRRGAVILMWSSITVLTGLGAFVGALAFPPGSSDNKVTMKIIACIEGMCGGAMLAMIANTVLPEAFEEGGSVVGISTLCGFLTAVAVSVM